MALLGGYRLCGHFSFAGDALTARQKDGLPRDPQNCVALAVVGSEKNLLMVTGKVTKNNS